MAFFGCAFVLTETSTALICDCDWLWFCGLATLICLFLYIVLWFGCIQLWLFLFVDLVLATPIRSSFMYAARIDSLGGGL